MAAPDGRVFVGTGSQSSPMTPSLFNKAIKRVWVSFVRIDKRPENPPASALTSSYLRNISAVHSNASQDQMVETAAHMSHTLTTAETHYKALSALELTSRACKLFSQHLCADNSELNDATGLLCSSDDNTIQYKDKEEDVEQNISSRDASLEDDVSDVEDIDDTPNCPVNNNNSDNF